MRKVLFTLLTLLVCCLCMVGCGGGDGGETEPAADTGEKAERIEATSIVGVWECVDMTMEDNGVTMNKEDLEELFSKKISKMAALKASEDGTGELSFMEISGPMTWTESEGVYTITMEDSDEDASALTAELKDGNLVMTSESSYSSDGAEVKSVVTITFECRGEE
ncbi:MAG: hypothetical protein ACI4KL_01495 [Lentihominibacter sp.]